jgi:glutamate/aspartate transport system substrate-binding protein
VEITAYKSLTRWLEWFTQQALFEESLMKKQLIALSVFAALSIGVAAQTNDTIAKVKSTGAITMGVRDSSGALAFTVGDGKYMGYNVEICQRIVANLEKSIGKKVQVNYQLVTSQNRIPLVQNGTVDIECGSTTNSLIRQKDVAFTMTTYVEEVRTAVLANSSITSVAQLNGKTVATTTGTTSVQLLRKHERATGVNFKEIFGKDHADSFLLLESGRADAFVMDNQILAGLIANSKTPSGFKIVGEVLNTEPIGIMIRKDDPAFKKLADDTIVSMAKSGELAKLYDKWYMQPIPPKNARLNMPASEANKALWAAPNDKPVEDYAKK